MINNQSEFEIIFIQVQKFMEDLHIQAQEELTIKTRRTCGDFSKLQIPYKHQRVTDNLSKNKKIIVIRKD